MPFDFALVPLNFKAFFKSICNVIKQNESEVKKKKKKRRFLVFWHFLSFFDFLWGYYLGFNLVKTPQRLSI